MSPETSASPEVAPRETVASAPPQPSPSPVAGAKGDSGPRSGFIVSPFFDCLFFIFAPVLALVIGYGVAYTPVARQPWPPWVVHEGISGALLQMVVFAHLILVFFRSHGNRHIFALYPIRFTVVPLLLFLGCWQSWQILVCTSVLATWWDVYHSGLQTFGLGRIYDMRAGNDAQAGRRLDYFLNLLLYVGPILGGAALMDHVNDFKEFGVPEVGWTTLASIPMWVAPRRTELHNLALAVAIPFLLYYLWAYWKLTRSGYRVSWQKVTLYVVTGAVSLFSWGYNGFGQAFLIMNFFHAWQYFAIVWWSENKNLSERFGVAHWRLGKPITFAIVFGSVGLYAIWSYGDPGKNTAVLAVTLVVSIMHFWYDGFIWSVRKKQIAS